MVVKDISHGRILQVDLHTGSVVKLPPLISKVSGLALDKSTITLFYFDQLTSTIMTTTLHGRNTTPFYKTGKINSWCFTTEFCFTITGIFSGLNHLNIIICLFMRTY